MSAPIYPKTKHSTESGVAPLTKPASSRNFSIGRILLEKGKISPEDAECVLRLQKESGMRFGDAALKLGLITEMDIQQALAQQFDYPYLLPGEGDHPPELVVAYQPFCARVEIYRAIRSQLMLRWFSSGHKALAVISSNPDDGLSLFIANLAVVFSQLGERTLLVDANLRYPQQHQIFNLTNKRGLSDVLAGRAAISDVISRVESFVDLSVMSAGTLPPNPLELLSRDQFSDLSECFASEFDVILYDTPAFLSGADALAIAACAEGVLLVAHKNNTRLADINNLNEQVINSGAEVVGSVLIDF